MLPVPMKGRASKVKRSLAHSAEFRFYEELNDFLPVEQRKRALPYCFNGNPGIKDPIEVFGVPHTEVDLIIVNGESVGFDYKLKNADRVAVYPVFESLDITPIIKLRDQPLRRTAFIVDVNLGKLARLLRLFGFDTLFCNRYDDGEIVALAEEQKRIVLTRDRRLLFAKRVTHGYWVRSVEPRRQLSEVVVRFDLSGLIKPFYRCTVCNGLIAPVEKLTVLPVLEPKTKQYFENFYRCGHCGRVYWEGSHIGNIKKSFAQYFPAGDLDSA
ncbi:MAG: Mut7-C RNAse domain-containing protein [Gammaproteobacteria bacterium]